MKPSHALPPLLLAALLSGCASPPPQSNIKPTVISSARELPSREIQLDRAPSELLDAPIEALQPLLMLLASNLEADTRRYEITDPTTRAERARQRAALAALRGMEPEMVKYLREARALQTKASARETAGLLTELLAPAARRAESPVAVRALLVDRLRALPSPLVDEDLRLMMGRIGLNRPALIRGSLADQLDAPARAAGLRQPEAAVLQVLEARLQLDLLSRYGDQVQSALQEVLASRPASKSAEDLWQGRTYTLQAQQKLAAVRVGIWDSGVDMALFRPADPAGLAFNADGGTSSSLLRPLPSDVGDAASLRSLVKGAMDLRAGGNTAEAASLKEKLVSLKPADAPAFQRNLQEGALHLHGTHVAGIAVSGNPFAEVFAATQHWATGGEMPRPSRARAEATAAVYRNMVAAMKTAGVRVVTLSWRYGPAAYEAMIARHSPEQAPAARRAEALELFSIERDALKQAMAGAPEILFIAGAGNEGNDAGFDEYLPASLQLPNLLTVGAVDRSLRETSFSSSGSSVHLYADGHEVDSVTPGGARMRLSGTSMATPQVANAAAKLLAEWPELDTARLRALLIETATPGVEGAAALRVLHPARAREAASAMMKR